MKVAWSPSDNDTFLTYTNSIINLYQTRVLRGEQVPKGSLQISDDVYAINLATLADIHLMKCVEWYPGPTTDHLVAIGQANGKVILSNFGQKGESDLIGKEFIPKHLRHCLYLAWNPVNYNLLAEGLDKHRNDCCISIWDINTRVNTELSFDRQRYNSNFMENAVNKPLVEIGLGEATSSFAWFNKEPRTFVTGINGKCLKVYDLRDATRPHLTTPTKYVNGACTDPHHESRLAVFSENVVMIWDVRQFDKPMLTLPCDRAVLKIDWCPTRTGILAVLCRDSSVVKLYDIRLSQIGNDDLEPVYFEQNIHPHRQHAVVYFSWHPTNDVRLMTVTPTGNLADNQIFEKLQMTLSPSMSLSWMFGKTIVNIEDFGSDVDMSTRIKLRALQGYGLHQSNLWNNAVVVADEPYLHALWHWLDLSNNFLMKEETPKKSNHLSRYIGVLDLLNNINHHSEVLHCSWNYPPGAQSNSKEQTNITQYRSPARSRALQLCGWWDECSESGSTDPLAQFIDRLVNDNFEFERAAAIAVFNLNIGRAVEILSSPAAVSANPSAGMVAMALSGYTEEKNALWRKTCASLRVSLANSYLRAMFAFLAFEKENYDDVLNDEFDMAVKDRVAFACIYLGDNQLSTYLNDLSKQMKHTGNLDGILLTGLTNEDGLELLQKYVDITCDIQTAALAVVYSSPNELTKDERAVTWIESYRSLLDRWQLWNQRAKFDIIRHTMDKSRVQSQAFVSCNFCGKSIACNMTLASRSRSGNYSSLPPTNRPKITCCPGCRKPLPRCALCLTNLGTPSGSGLNEVVDKTEYNSKLSSFDSWFTWCQSCRHGGHSSHITSWFSDHTECPVTGCPCKCMTLDLNSQLTAVQALVQNSVIVDY